MLFAHDTEVALAAAAALVNTARTTPAAWTTSPTSTRSSPSGAGPARAGTPGPSCDAVRALRPRLRAALVRGRGRRRSRSSTRCCARPTPCRSWPSTTSGTTTCTPTSDAPPLADRMAVEAAMAVVDVDPQRRARPAAGVRRRRLRRRRWSTCRRTGPAASASSGCGNRANVAGLPRAAARDARSALAR